MENTFFVGVQGDNIVIMNPRSKMSSDEALNLAAWLVALADAEGKFADTLKAVQNT